jgi:hypothetical protein
VHKLLITNSNKVTEVSLFSDISSIQKIAPKHPSYSCAKKTLSQKLQKAMMVVTDPSSKSYEGKEHCVPLNNILISD